ncbi:MAG: hypothetical protein J07HX5_01581 [halophilic archaeon J07HX5]|nr:MAG: hypothetical protein J07HX5_01581 [halophilic archaeon J07HX5]
MSCLVSVSSGRIAPVGELSLLPAVCLDCPATLRAAVGRCVGGCPTPHALVMDSLVRLGTVPLLSGVVLRLIFV